MEWEVVIGLEIHAQLATKSKIFSAASTAYGETPNTQACAVDLGLPGVLPVLNAQAVNMAIKFGAAIGAEIPASSVFARKNYFYPDLPKGYQISQFELPVVGKGEIEIELEGGQTKIIGVTRAHLEEDAGKSLHEDFQGMTGIDLNRAGTPLLEIVSEPDLRSAKEAVAYMKKIHSLVRYLEICDGNMQEGSFRCDANVSIRKKGDELGTRTELKNINSFRFVERAINVEVARQAEILENDPNAKILLETRLYDAATNTTHAMRSKEEANDYRYFPDPDLLPLEVSQALIDEIKSNLPELPDPKKNRFINDYGLSPYDAGVLTASKELAEFYEEVVSSSANKAKLAVNWVNGELAAMLNKNNLDITQSPVSPKQLGGMVKLIGDGGRSITGKIAKQVFEAMWNGEGDAEFIVDKNDWWPITDTGAVEKSIDEIIAANPQQVEQYQGGQEKLLGFFVGQVMKATKGKANPAQVNKLLKDKLQKQT